MPWANAGSGSRAFAAALLLSCLTGGCSSDVNPIKAAFVGAGHGPRPLQAPDFVEQTRRSDIGYTPVGESAPRRALRARSTEGQKVLEAELEGARSRNEAQGRAAQGAAKATGQGLETGRPAGQ